MPSPREISAPLRPQHGVTPRPGRLAFLALLALVTACSDLTSGPPVSATPSPSLGSGSSSLLVAASDTQEFSWYQDHVPTPMGSTAGRVCFLTYVGGDFDWASEYVRIYASGGTWYLYGGSLQTGVKGKARCVPVTSYTSEYSVSAPRGTAASVGLIGNACGLTRVGGLFKGNDDRATVLQSISSPTHWTLQVRASAAANGYVHARARCVGSGAFLSTDGYWRNHYPTTLLSSNAGVTCYLTGITGDFNASTYWVRAYKSSGRWYLNGSTQKDWGGAYAGCVKPYFFAVAS